MKKKKLINSTKRQHYVPQFYLKQWTDDLGGFYPIKIEVNTPPQLSLFDKKSSPSKFCFENFFYANHTGEEDAVSQILEKSFADMEGSFSGVLPSIEAKILNNEQITYEDKYKLSEFMIFIWLRGKKHREDSRKMSEDMTKQVNKHIIRYSVEGSKMKAEMDKLGLKKEDLIDFVDRGEYSVDFGNIHHLALMRDMQGFCNLLSAKYWKVYISRNDEFITTDAPYLDKALSDKFWGNDFLSREQSFILSPRVMIVALYPKNENGKKFSRQDITNERGVVQGINMLNLMNSIRFGFHSDKNLLNELHQYTLLEYKLRMNRGGIKAL